MRSSILTALHRGFPFEIDVKHLPLEQLNRWSEGWNFQEVRRTDTGLNSGEFIYSGNGPEGLYFKFDYPDDHDRITFIVHPSGRSVFWSSTETPTSKSINSVLKGVVAKCCLQLQQEFCLHAGGVRIGEKVVLFVGPKGAGKSTLSAFFNVKGHEIWCDDYCILDMNGPEVLCWRGDASPKIDKTASRHLQISEHTLESVFAKPDHWIAPGESSDFGDKYYFQPSRDHVSPADQLPLAAIVFLKERTSGAIALSTMSPVDALRKLMDEIMLPGVVPKSYVSSYFSAVSRLMGRTQLLSLRAPDDLSRIGEGYSAILQQLP